MSSRVRRVAAALLMLGVALVLAGANTAADRSRNVGDGARSDAIGAPDRRTPPTDAVTPLAPSRLADQTQPSRSRSRWLAEVLGALVLAAVALGRSGRWTVPALVHRATSAVAIRPVLGRAPPAVV